MLLSIPKDLAGLKPCLRCISRCIARVPKMTLAGGVQKHGDTKGAHHERDQDVLGNFHG